MANGGGGSGAFGRVDPEIATEAHPPRIGGVIGGRGGDHLRPSFGNDEGVPEGEDEEGARGGAGGWHAAPTAGANSSDGATRNSGGGGGGSQGVIWLQSRIVRAAPRSSPSAQTIPGVIALESPFSICGDGIVQPTEGCDDGPYNVAGEGSCGCTTVARA